MGRRPRSRFDLLHPDIYRKVRVKQDKVLQDNRCTIRKFLIGDNLYARNYSGTQKWIPVTVVKITGPVSYQIKTKSGNVIKRHVDQLCFRHIDTEDVFDSTEDFKDLFVDWKICPSSPLVPSQAPVESHTTPTSTGGTLCRSNRVRQPVTTYAPMVSN